MLTNGGGPSGDRRAGAIAQPSGGPAARRARSPRDALAARCGPRVAHAGILDPLILLCLPQGVGVCPLVVVVLAVLDVNVVDGLPGQRVTWLKATGCPDPGERSTVRRS
jgi:hypothetical protein